jgi:pimeloyl-ACP methyl ester carboxylesterase
VTWPDDRWANVDGRRIRYWLEGSGPSVVVLGGLGTTVADWTQLVPALSTCSSVLVHDRAGLGASDADPRPRTAGRMVDDLQVLLRESALAPPYLRVGHSWGGLVARLLAHRSPELVSGSVLVDATHEDTVGRGAAAMNALTYRVLQSLAAAGVLRPMLARSRTYRGYPPDAREYALSDLRGTARTARREAAGIPASLEELAAARAAVPTLRCPMVALSAGGTGARRGPTAKAYERLHSLHRELTSRNEDGYHRVVEGAGHYVHLDRPDAVVEAVRHLLGPTRGAS